jgi:hypothetical protein
MSLTTVDKVHCFLTKRKRKREKEKRERKRKKSYCSTAILQESRPIKY